MKKILIFSFVLLLLLGEGNAAAVKKNSSVASKPISAAASSPVLPTTPVAPTSVAPTGTDSPSPGIQAAPSPTPTLETAPALDPAVAVPEDPVVDDPVEDAIEAENVDLQDGDPRRDPGEDEDLGNLRHAPNPSNASQNPADFLKNFQGKFETDLFSGSATFRYPVWVPQGRRGMTPELFFSYASTNSRFDSLVGYGWELPTNAIYRSTRRGSDKLFTRHDFTADINGSTEELVLLNEEDGRFGAKNETSFTRYIFEDNQWIATDTRGREYTFGASEDTRQQDPDDDSRVYKWLLERATEPNGNFISYTYSHDSGQVYPATIRYTGHGNQDGLFEIRFVWGAREAYASYERGFRTTTRRVLDRVEIYSFETGNPVLRVKYTLTHSSHGAVVHLTSIRVQSEQDSLATIPPLRFQYFSQNTEHGKMNFLQNIRFPYGAIQSFRYKVSTLYRENGVLQNRLPFPVYTLHESRLVPFPNAAEQVTRYDYEGGHYFFDVLDAFKKEYAGFHRVTVTDPVGNVKKLYFHQSEASRDNEESALRGEWQDHISKKGRIYREEIFDDEEHLFQKTIRRWTHSALADADEDSARFFISLAQEVTVDFDGDDDSRARGKSFSYDPFGNKTLEIDWGELTLLDESGNFQDLLQDRTETQIQYAQNEFRHMVSFPSRSAQRDFFFNVIGEEHVLYDFLAPGAIQSGNETRRETLATLPDEFTATEMRYNQYGLPTEFRNARGFVTEVQYDPFFLYPSRIQNPLGQQVIAHYNVLFGIPDRVTGPNGDVRATILDGLGRVKEIRLSSLANPQELLKTRNRYSLSMIPIGIQSTQFLGHDNISMESWAYFDGLGRLMQTRKEFEDAGQFIVTNILYDARGNVAKEFLPLAKLGFKFSAQNPNEVGNEYEYDARNRKILTRNPLGETSVVYDQWEQHVTDPNDNRKDFVFDARENLVSVREFLNNVMHLTQYTYNALNQLTEIRDARQDEKHFTYDARGLLLTEEEIHQMGDPTFGMWTHSYDQNGNLISTIKPDEGETHFTYDELDRMTDENFLGAEGVEIQYTYDDGENQIGRLSRVRFAGGEKNFSYDLFGRILSSALTIGEGEEAEEFPLSFTYDLQDNIRSVTYPNDLVATYTRDSAGLLQSVRKQIPNQDAEDVITDIRYNPMGPVRQMTFANDVVTTNEFPINQMYRLSHRVTRSGETNLQDISYEYDPVGNITRIVDASDTDAAKIAEYEYDDLSRLTRAEITEAANDADFTQEFSYDILGNMVTHSAHQAPYLYAGLDAAQARDTLASPHAVTSIGNRVFTYDANGNLTRETIPGSDWTHTWDWKDRLVGSVLDDLIQDKEIRYTYDEAKQRVLKNNVTDEEVTMYIDKYFDREGEEEKVYIYAGDTKVSTLKQDGENWVPIYHHEDHLTGANVDTDEDGEILQLLDYFPYGESRIDDHVENYENDYKFTGKEKDDETGLYYYESRYYNSEVGRFISRDPWKGELEDPQSLNKYSYVLNNPLKYVDPEGEKTEVFIRLMNGIDTGHAMININGMVFGFGDKKGRGLPFAIGRIKEDSIPNYLNYYAGPRGNEPNSVYTSFELDISSRQETKLLESLNKQHTESNIELYNLFSNNCVDFVIRNINKNSDLKLEDQWAPNSFSKTLYKRYEKKEGVKNFSIGYEKQGQLIKITPNKKDSYSRIVDRAKSGAREARKDAKNDDKNND